MFHHTGKKFHYQAHRYREISFSRHLEDQITGTPETPRTPQQTMVLRGLRGASIVIGTSLRQPMQIFPASLHTEKSFRNFIKSTRNQIAFTIFRLIWNQTVVRLVPNQSQNCKYNLISA